MNPAFDSQTKETLTTTPARFGSKFVLSANAVNAVLRSPILDAVLLWAQTKAQVELRRQLGGKPKGRERLTGIPKLEDANEAGKTSCRASTKSLAGLSSTQQRSSRG